MTPATAAPKPKIERRTLPDRVRFVADLAEGGTPLKITLERQKEIFDGETGKKQVVTGSGRYVHFKADGPGLQSFETDDPDLAQELRVRANTFGVYNEVPIQKPASDAVLRQIVSLSLQRDIESLTALYREEEETYRREDVLSAIEEAVEALA